VKLDPANQEDADAPRQSVARAFGGTVRALGNSRLEDSDAEALALFDRLVEVFRASYVANVEGA
jgi:hypothetical protein